MRQGKLRPGALQTTDQSQEYDQISSSEIDWGKQIEKNEKTENNSWKNIT